jgi:hypothetical protein
MCVLLEEWGIVRRHKARISGLAKSAASPALLFAEGVMLFDTPATSDYPNDRGRISNHVLSENSAVMPRIEPAE